MKNEVILGNCVEVMAKMPDESVHAVITDPPYGVSFKNVVRSPGVRLVGDKQAATSEDWWRAWMEQAARVLKPDRPFYSFCYWKRLPVMYAVSEWLGLKPRGYIIVVKKNRAPGDCKYGYATRYEGIFYATKGGHTPNYADKREEDVWVWHEHFYKIKARLHDTEKPVSLLTRLVQNATDRKGQVVLDPFCGAGSTLVAASNLKRRYVGIEIEAKHVETARSRLGN